MTGEDVGLATALAIGLLVANVSVNEVLGKRATGPETGVDPLEHASTASSKTGNFGKTGHATPQS